MGKALEMVDSEVWGLRKDFPVKEHTLPCPSR